MDDQRPRDSFIARLRVRHYEMDALGHVNNAVYLHYLEDAGWQHSNHLGMTWERYNELGGIFVLRRMEIDYLRPAVAGDPLEIATWVHEMHGPRAVRKYQITHAETRQVLLRATGLWAWIDRATERPRRIPAAIFATFGSPPTAGGEQEKTDVDGRSADRDDSSDG